MTQPRPADAALLRRLELLVTRRLDGLLSGDYNGFLPGPGSETAGARAYEPGDDVRLIDWNLTARTGHTHVRTTDAERELTAWVVVDTSASLDFGTAKCEKRDLALGAAAAVGFLTARRGNRVGGVVTGGERLVVVPPAPGAAGVHTLLRAIARAPRREAAPGERATLAAALSGLASGAYRRGFVAVVSDFQESGWERPLRALGTRHDVAAFVTGDRRERDLPPVGLLTLVDPETGRRVEVQTASAKLRKRYAEAAAAQVRDRTRALRQAGASVVDLDTDRDWLLDIVKHVGSRRRALATGARP